jgi:hypothetical protein
VPPCAQIVGGPPLENLIVNSMKCHEFKDANICWYLFVPSQDGWKTSLHGLKRPRRWPDVC